MLQPNTLVCMPLIGDCMMHWNLEVGGYLTKLSLESDPINDVCIRCKLFPTCSTNGHKVYPLIVQNVFEMIHIYEKLLNGDLMLDGTHQVTVRPEFL